jgi:acetylornithine deacetylase/succinyl-diaminopimelate desuccinylase-like protein
MTHQELIMRALLGAFSMLFLAPSAHAQTDWRANGREMFSDIVAIPSVSDRPVEVKRLISYLKGRFEKGGIPDVMVRDHDGTQSMMVRWSAGKRAKKKPIMLIGHLDVVEALPSDWSKQPFTLTEEAGYLYGRGATDMKNGITAITNALIWLKAEGFTPKRDIIVLFTGDEETDGNGARRAVTEWLKGEKIDFALNADAGGGGFLASGTALGFGIQTSEKMYQSYAFTVRNPGGHSSRPRPDNAIYELATALKALEAHSFAPQLNETTRAYFAHRQKGEAGKLGDAMRAWLANPADGAAADAVEADPTETGMTRTRCVATRLEGGHADNALPALARATVNCRIFPGLAEADVRSELKTLVGAGVEITPLADAVPSPPSPLRADVVKAFTDAIQKRHPGAAIVPQMSTGATDGLFLRANGIPTYGVDGTWIVVPDDERAHGKDERIPVKSFMDNLDHWHDLVKAVAG